MCDGAYAKDGKLFGKCFYKESFKHLLTYENIDLFKKRVLLLGANGIGLIVLSSLSNLDILSVDIADTSVEDAAFALKMVKPTLKESKTDLLWFQSGMEVDVDRYDVIINAIDLYAHSDKKLIKVKGKNRDLILIDFVRGKSSFDTLSKELGCKKVGDYQWMVATALCVAKEWLSAKISYDDYKRIIKILGDKKDG